MNMNNHDLDWLAEQRPQRRGTDKEAHDRALLSLLRHATSRPGNRRRSGGRLKISGLVNPRILAVATGTGAAAIAAAVVLSAGTGAKLPVTSSHSKTGTLQAVVRHHSTKSPLIHLADNVSASAAPTGDATLIQRTTETGGQNITVYDLYGDNGTYYFSRDESGMPAQVSGGDNQGAGLFGREVAAAKKGAAGNVQQAAIDMANAPDPNRSPPMMPSNSAPTPTPQEAAAEKLKAKLTGTPQSPGTLFDNWAWEDSQDAMIAGAGDPQVRAGVLQILATLPGVTVTHGSSADGQPTLVLTGGADEVGSGYQEQLTVNAETGMPIGFVGGPPNGSPATQVEYKVARVTLSDVAAGQLPSF
jgi:hypothetical protein